MCVAALGVLIGGGEAAGISIGGASITGVIVGTTIFTMNPTATANSTKADPANDNCPPNFDCPAERARLVMLYEVLTAAAAEGMLTPSAIASYARQARIYNSICVPQGYQAVPTTFIR